jgi:hypothetical protein
LAPAVVLDSEEDVAVSEIYLEIIILLISIVEKF